ncbi:MAG: hypothetical protein QXR81_07535 [Candidatus Nezhaarchaeales archaeon]
MSVRRSEDPRVWAPLFERVVWQIAYRQLGMCALYCPIDVAAEAIDILCREKGMGDWKWLLTGRALVWEDVPVDEALRIHMYAFGGKTRRKNTVLVRQGFWRMYFIEAGLRLFNESIVGRILERI